MLDYQLQIRSVWIPRSSFDNSQRKYESLALQIPKERDHVKVSKVKVFYPTRYDQLKLYNRMSKTFTLTGISRKHCEAVVEGKGSVLCLNNAKRQLKVKQLLGGRVHILEKVLRNQ